MYQLMLNRKNSRKGFTLVEVIVVLVILAILAAIMIPAMTGWIDKAREKAVITEARTNYLAAVTLAAEHYGDPFNGAAVTAAAVVALSGVGEAGNITVTEDDTTGTISEFVYSANDVTCTWDADGVLTVS